MGLNRIKIVQAIIDKIDAKRYLEIGVHNGGCFLTIKARRKFGVDPHFQIPKVHKRQAFRRDYRNLFNQYIEKTSDEFFSVDKTIVHKKFDVVFIDGLHTYGQTLRDVENSLEALNPGGAIVMHDCLPPHEAASLAAPSLEEAHRINPPGWNGEWCGDVWKTILYLRCFRKDVSACVFDCDKGIGVVVKRKNSSDFTLSKEKIDELTYSELLKNKETFIGLRSEETFAQFLNTF